MERNDNLNSKNDPTPEGTNNNRPFVIAVGILGGIILVSLACLAGVYLFTRQNAASTQQAQAENAAATQTVQAFIDQSLTATFQSAVLPTTTVTVPLTITPSVTPQPSVTHTPNLMVSDTQAAATATVGAAYTQAAVAQNTVFPTTTAISQPLPNPTLSTQDQFELVDAELKRSLTGSFSYTAPTSMKLDESFTIQLLLNPSMSPAQLATQIVENSGFATSTAQPGQLVTNGGQEVNIESNTIELTPNMKAILVSEDPQAFEIQRLHDNDIQIVSGTFSTSWLWVIKANKEGAQRLIIVIYRLVKIDETEIWREVQTYKSDINVKVTMAQRIKSLDWKWVVVTISGVLITAFWRWYDNKQKQIAENKELISDTTKKGKTRKK